MPPAAKKSGAGKAKAKENVRNYEKSPDKVDLGGPGSAPDSSVSSMIAGLRLWSTDIDEFSTFYETNTRAEDEKTYGFRTPSHDETPLLQLETYDSTEVLGIWMDGEDDAVVAKIIQLAKASKQRMTVKAILRQYWDIDFIPGRTGCACYGQFNNNTKTYREKLHLLDSEAAASLRYRNISLHTPWKPDDKNALVIKLRNELPLYGTLKALWTHYEKRSMIPGRTGSACRNEYTKNSTWYKRRMGDLESITDDDDMESITDDDDMESIIDDDDMAETDDDLESTGSVESEYVVPTIDDAEVEIAPQAEPRRSVRPKRLVIHTEEDGILPRRTRHCAVVEGNDAEEPARSGLKPMYVCQDDCSINVVLPDELNDDQSEGVDILDDDAGDIDLSALLRRVINVKQM